MLKFVLILTGLLFVESKNIREPPPIRSGQIFAYDDEYNYIVSDYAVEWAYANQICKKVFGGWLATLDTPALQKHLINMIQTMDKKEVDGLWVNLVKKNGMMQWADTNTAVPDHELVRCGNNSVNPVISSDDIECGIIIRANHSNWCLAKLNCDARRGMICKTLNNGSIGNDGWIDIGPRRYKIFHKSLTWEDARRQCVFLHQEAKLAVITSFKDAKQLVRYLLIGRPSLERAWIGAAWKNGNYKFEDENLILSNETKPNGYPPWRNGKMSLTKGCLLLDRHVTKVTLFVESRCNRFQPYICYKTNLLWNRTICSSDSKYDYKMFGVEQNFYMARNACEAEHESGRLPVLDKDEIKFFVHMMEAYEIDMSQAWLGGVYINGKWIWLHTNESIPVNGHDGYPPWVRNKTYIDDEDARNICLNIDRENTLFVMIYGVVCECFQHYICQFDKGALCSNLSTTEPTTTTTN